MSRGMPQGRSACKKVKNHPCPECGQLFTPQKLPLHIKERHPNTE